MTARAVPAAAVLSRREARKEDRRRSILAEAERSFFEQGYAGTSMSGIAAAMGGSKATLWTYYASKEALFEALLDSKINAFADALDMALTYEGGVGAALQRFGEVFLVNILRADFCAMRQLVSSEGMRFPEMAAMMYDRGPRQVRDRLTRYLERQMAAGALRSGDATIAARQFLGLCQAISFSDRIWRRPDAPQADPAGDVGHAVDTFLRAWRSGSPAAPQACIVAM